MRRYKTRKKETIEYAYCNLCGRAVKIENGIIKEGVMSVEQHWGYFSEKDGQIHSFELCEDCYDRLTEQFVLPVAVTDEKEFL